MPSKPKKPRRDFPLFAHANGQWAKKILGDLHYFGPWSDPQNALANYLEDKDDLQAGRTPVRKRGKATTEAIVNLYLARCEDRVATGELAAVSFRDYVIVGKLIVKHLGRRTDPEQLRPEEFAKFRAAMAAKYAPSRLSKIITVTRTMIRWAYESEHIAQLPRFGPDFAVASKKAARVQRSKQGKKLLTQAEVTALLGAADPKWKAILLLSLNAALGNSDIARLKLSDFGGDWLDFPRGKTGTDRKAWLWPETREAVQKAIVARPNPKAEAEDLLFLSAHGGPLLTVRDNGKKTDLTVEGFRRLAKEAGVYKHRMGLYWVRHTSATIMDQAKDRAASMVVLGHIDNSMTGGYVETIGDERLKAVTDHVRQWLYPPKPKEDDAGDDAPEGTESRDAVTADGKPQLRIVG